MIWARISGRTRSTSSGLKAGEVNTSANRRKPSSRFEDRKAETRPTELRPEKADMEAQRDGILDEARAQAAAIVADAEKRAKAAEEQARYFQDYIRNTADTVRRQAENYAGFLENYEHIGVGQQPETEKIDTPDEYRNPAELIKSIYNIEGRELPDEVTKPDAGQEPEEEKVWTVDEVVSEEKHDDDDADKADDGLDSELNDILNDILKLD